MMQRLVVRDWMTPHPVSIDSHTTLPEAHRLMKDCGVEHLPVVENGRLVGIVTLGDLRDASPAHKDAVNLFELNYLLARLTVEQVMTRDPLTIASESSVQAAARLMLEHQVRCLPVVDGTKLVGIITESDIFRLLVNESEPKPVFA